MAAGVPALFVSHGAPSMIIEECPTRSFLRNLGRTLERPKGIVCVSAHWTTPQPLVTLNPQPPTIHDFGGFAEELYSLTYPAPGAPQLAARVLELLQSHSISAERDPSRGFDHGAWIPLMLMYPEADIPLVQLSVQPHLGPEHHLAMGTALRSLRNDDVLILASGSATHNLLEFFGQDMDSVPPDHVVEFSAWLKDAVVHGRTDDLLQYARRAPHALRNHPTPEHLLPLFVALGSGGDGRVIHDSFTYGILSMTAFEWR